MALRSDRRSQCRRDVTPYDCIGAALRCMTVVVRADAPRSCGRGGEPFTATTAPLAGKGPRRCTRRRGALRASSYLVAGKGMRPCPEPGLALPGKAALLALDDGHGGPHGTGPCSRGRVPSGPATPSLAGNDVIGRPQGPPSSWPRSPALARKEVTRPSQGPVSWWRSTIVLPREEPIHGRACPRSSGDMILGKEPEARVRAPQCARPSRVVRARNPRKSGSSPAQRHPSRAQMASFSCPRGTGKGASTRADGPKAWAR
jgi:hypothetical protein